MAYHRRERKFGRERAQRDALMRSLIRSALLHGRIKTTEARAKSVRPRLERLVTKAKKKDLSVRRQLLAYFGNDERTVTVLLDTVAPRYTARPGGYTRISKVEPRPGSGRRVAVLEFV